LLKKRCKKTTFYCL